MAYMQWLWNNLRIGGGVMKQIALKDHLENRLRELKEERKELKKQRLRSVKESNDIKYILQELDKNG
jgi:hypothetical protein